MKLEELNRVLKDVLGLEPLEAYEEPKTELEESMKQGLAEMYTNQGFRKYLQNAIRIATYNAAVSSDDEIKGAVLKGRMITLAELLAKSHQAFARDFERVKKLKKNAADKKGKEDIASDAKEVRL